MGKLLDKAKFDVLLFLGRAEMWADSSTVAGELDKLCGCVRRAGSCAEVFDWVADGAQVVMESSRYLPSWAVSQLSACLTEATTAARAFKHAEQAVEGDGE